MHHKACNKRLVISTIFVITLLLCGCASLRIGSEKGGWGRRWWNYYEWGLEAKEKGLYKEAIQHFDMAIRQKPEDQWNVWTHWVIHIDYFPNREKGIAYYLMSQYDKAIENLELSVSQTDTSKARAYLDLARRETLFFSKKDKVAPVIVIDSPKKGEFVDDFKVVVSGTVEDDFYVEKIWINDEAYPLALTAKKVDFRKKVQLTDAEAKIVICAMDLVGRETEQSVNVKVHWQWPLLNVVEPREGEFVSPQMKVSGTAFSEVKIVNVRIKISPEEKEQLATLTPIPEDTRVVNFEAKVELDPQMTEHTILVTAIDSLNKETQTELKILTRVKEVGVPISPYPQAKLNTIGLMKTSALVGNTVLHNEFLPSVHHNSLFPPSLQPPFFFQLARQKSEPLIQIVFPIYKNRQTIYSNNPIIIPYEVDSEDAIRYIEWSHWPEGDLEPREKHKEDLFFSVKRRMATVIPEPFYFLPDKYYVIQLRAHGWRGEEGEKTIVIKRMPSIPLIQEERLKVLIVPLEVLPKPKNREKERLLFIRWNDIISSLRIEDVKRFNIFQTEKIESQPTRTDYVKKAIEKKNEVVIWGTIDREEKVIYMYVVSTMEPPEGTEIWSPTASITDTEEKALHEIAGEIKGSIPIATGIVRDDAKARRFEVDWDELFYVKSGMKILICEDLSKGTDREGWIKKVLDKGLKSECEQIGRSDARKQEKIVTK